MLSQALDATHLFLDALSADNLQEAGFKTEKLSCHDKNKVVTSFNGAPLPGYSSSSAIDFVCRTRRSILGRSKGTRHCWSISTSASFSLNKRQCILYNLLSSFGSGHRHDLFDISRRVTLVSCWRWPELVLAIESKMISGIIYVCEKPEGLTAGRPEIELLWSY